MGRGGERGEEGEGSCENLLHHHMSEDVLIQIFLYLPVISLLRFKSVCKSLRSIIENPFFIHLHATTTTKSGGGGGAGFLFFRYSDHKEEEKKKRNMFTLSGDRFEVFENLGRPSVEFEEITGEWWGERKTFYNGIAMVGCCNGIICLQDCFSRSFALWNPAVKQSRILPKPSNLLEKNHYNNNNDLNSPDSVIDFVGFGIDVKTNDYKLLLITSLEPFDSTTPYDEYNSNLVDDKTKFPFARSVQVYSLSTDSWKCIDANLSAAHPNLEIRSSLTPLHLNGRFFFMAQYYIKVEQEQEQEQEDTITDNSGLQAIPLIMSFDFTQEVFRTIELPYDNHPHSSYAGLLPFGEKIALKDFLGGRPDSESDIWLLNEQQQQGVMEEESWTKFYTFGPYKIPYSPQCIVDNGEFAIMLHGYYDQGQKLQLLNLSTGETNDLLYDCKDLRAVDVYKPSLVPIGGNGATADKPDLWSVTVLYNPYLNCIRS